MDTSEAVSTIYHELGLNDEADRIYRDYLAKLAIHRKRNQFRRNKAVRKSHQISEFSFYNKGFSYYAFRDDDSRYEMTYFGFTSVTMTPEKYMVALCRRFKVVGLSATALVPSSYTNYNLDFLKSELGDGFHTLTENKKDLFKYMLRERFAAYREPVVVDGEMRKVDIVLETLVMTNENELKKKYTDLFPKKALHKTAANYDALCAEVAKAVNGSPAYFLNRYVNVFEVMRIFFTTPDMRSILCLHMPKAEDGNLFSNKIFTSHFGDFKTCFHIHDAELIFLEAEGYEKKKEEITALVGSGTKVFVMSSYATVSKGQNFKFPISQTERKSTFKIYPCGPEDSRGNTKDFDAIFLGPLTQQLVNNPSSDDGTELKALYEITEYYNGGELSYNEHMESIGDVFTHKKHYSHQSVLRASQTIRAGNTAMILQSIGRMSRTFCKKKNVYIFTTEDVLQQMDVSFLDNELISPEMAAIVQACEALPRNQQEVMASELKRLLNSMSIATAEFNNYLNKLVYSVWTEESVRAYLELSDYIMKHPTINMDELLPEYRSVYIRDLEGRGEYFYRQARDGHNYEISFSKEKGYNFAVNEAESMLSLFLKYPGAKEHLESKGWSTSFDVGTHILNPVALRNIYKGRLGEVACEWIVTNEFKKLGYTIKFNDIKDLSVFEKFDFDMAPGVYVDAKNWKDSFLRSQDAELEKIYGKMEKTDANAVFYINLTSEYDKPEAHVSPDGRRTVHFIPRLLMPTGEVDTNMMMCLLKEMQNYDCIDSV